MIAALSTLQRRALAIGLLFSLVSVIWVAIVDPILSFARTAGTAREADLRALSRDHALLARDTDIKDALTAVSQSAQWTRLYDGQKPDKAVLQLETDLRSLITTTNNPISMTSVPLVTRGPLTRIAVKVTLSMPVDQFASMLGRLQGHSKLLLIENLTVQAPDYQNVNTNPTLSIQADIAGFMLTPSRAST